MVFLTRKLGKLPTISQFHSVGKFGNAGTAGRWHKLALLPEADRAEFFSLVDADNREKEPKLNLSNILEATNPTQEHTLVLHARLLCKAPAKISKEGAKVCSCFILPYLPHFVPLLIFYTLLDHVAGPQGWGN
jgi:hypothetical protein